MPDELDKISDALEPDLYSSTRADTERLVNDLLAELYYRRRMAVRRHLRDWKPPDEAVSGDAVGEAKIASLIELKMSLSLGFAHALLKGAIEAFDDEMKGLMLLKHAVESELVELKERARFDSRATSSGSRSVN